MDKPKFTPGPWSICWTMYDNRPVNFDIVASPYGSIRPIAVSKWKTDWSEVEGEELKANAHLIAAAPELFKACRIALRYWHSDHPNDTVEWHVARARIEAALAKAEGR